MNPILQRNFDKGLVTRVEGETIPRGAASDSLNWHFLGDRVELRRGQKVLGAAVAGVGRVTFVRVGRKYNGNQVPFWGYGRKFLYYNGDTNANVEIGSDVLPSTADGEDISAVGYQSLAGSFLYASSPNSGAYKIPIANPGSVVDLEESTYRGFLKASQGRLFLWNRKDKYGGSDKTGLNVSTIDKDSLADYDLTVAEDVGTGNGSTSAFSGTLAFKASAPKKTCHFVRIAAAVNPLKVISNITQATSGVVTATAHGLAVGDVVVLQDVVGMTQINKLVAVVLTVPTADTFTIDIDTTGFTAYSSGGNVGKAELFTDDRSGGLVGSVSGTGTINYATGAFSVTFSANVTNLAEVVADYYTEDSTSGGVFDFEQGSGSSIADSQTFRQDDAGFFQNIGIINGVNYCLHTIKTYALSLFSSTEMTNLPYRDKVGIPYWRAKVDTGEGVYYLDATDPKDPQVRLLEVARYNAEVIPRSISSVLDLSPYQFDAAVMAEWGEYITLACRTNDSSINNRLFMYHRLWKTWEVHNFRISDMDSYNGALIGGDSGSNNLVKFFTGLADDDSTIENYIIFGKDDLGKSGVKDIRRFRIAGMIGDDQQFEVSYSVDNEPFVVVETITGQGEYVDLSQRKVVGSLTAGEEQIGGGQSEEDAIFASPYAYEFLFPTPRFERYRVKIEAKQVGYLSVSEYGPIDWRNKGMRLPTKYVQNP